jgi:hypothetical protein
MIGSIPIEKKEGDSYSPDHPNEDKSSDLTP